MDKDQLQLRRQVGQLFDMIEETQKLAETTARAQDTRRTALMPGETMQIMDADGNVAAYFGGSNSSGQLIEHVSGPEPKRPSAPELDSPMPGVITVIADGLDEDGEEAQGNHDRVLIHLSHEEGFTPTEATAQHSFFGPEGRQDVSAEPGEWYVAIQWRTKTGQLSEPSERVAIEVLELVNSADIQTALDEAQTRLDEARDEFEQKNQERIDAIADLNEVVIPGITQTLQDKADSSELGTLDDTLRQAFGAADEAIQAVADAAKAEAEAAGATAGEAQSAADAAVADAQAAFARAEAAETAASTAEASADASAKDAADALTRAQAAGGDATAAQTAADAAQAAADAARGHADTAGTAAAEADAKAAQAAADAAAAQAEAVAAAESSGTSASEAQAAKDRADAAAADAAAAYARAQEAEESASSASGAASAAETAADTAATNAAEALTQAQNAGGDADAAQAAADLAQQHADTAQAQAGEANTAAANADADAAQAAADAAQAAADAVAAAQSSDTSASEAQAAKDRADAAAADASAAYTRAQEAEQSASSASGSASAAETAADTAASQAADALLQAQSAGGDASAAQAAATLAQEHADTAQAEAGKANTAAADADAKAAQAAADAAQAAADAIAAAESSDTSASEAQAAKDRADAAAADASAAYTRAQEAEDAASASAGSANAAETAADTAASNAADALAQAQASSGDATAAQAAADAAQGYADTAQAQASEANTKAATADANAAQAAADAAQAVADAAKAAQDAEEAKAEAESAKEYADDQDAEMLAAAATDAQEKADEARDDAQARAEELNRLLAGEVSAKGTVWPRSEAPPPPGTHYAWLGEPHASVSVRLDDDGNETARNWIKDPSFETGPPRAYGAADATELSSDHALRGNYSVRASDKNGGATRLGVNWQIEGPPGYYASSIWVYIPSTNTALTGRANFQWSSDSVSWRRIDLEFDQWFKLDDVRLIESGQSGSFWIGLEASGSLAGDHIYLDAAQVAIGDTEAEAISQIETYFDGSTPPDRAHDLWYNAEGVPHEWVNGTNGEPGGWMAISDERIIAATQAAQAAQEKADKAEQDAANAHSEAGEAWSHADAAMTRAAEAESTAIAEAKRLAKDAKDRAEEAIAKGKVIDTRNDNQPPSWYRANYRQDSVTEFKRRATMDIPGSGTYVYVTTVVPWSDQSGGPIVQTATIGDVVMSRETTGRGDDEEWLEWVDPVAEAKDLAENLPKVLHGTGAPSGTAPNGSIWWQHQGSLQGAVTAQWNRVDGSWVSTPIDSEAIANLDVGKLTAGGAVISDAVIQDLTATNGAFDRLDAREGWIGGVALEDDAVTARTFNAQEVFTDEATANTVWAEVVRAGLLTAEEALIGGALLKDGIIDVAHLNVTEQMTAELLRAKKIEADDIEANAFRGMTFTGNTFQTSDNSQTGIKLRGPENDIIAYDANGKLIMRIGDHELNLLSGRLYTNTPGEEPGIILSEDKGDSVGASMQFSKDGVEGFRNPGVYTWAHHDRGQNDDLYSSVSLRGPSITSDGSTGHLTANSGSALAVSAISQVGAPTQGGLLASSNSSQMFVGESWGDNTALLQPGSFRVDLEGGGRLSIDDRQVALGNGRGVSMVATDGVFFEVNGKRAFEINPSGSPRFYGDGRFLSNTFLDGQLQVDGAAWLRNETTFKGRTYFDDRPYFNDWTYHPGAPTSTNAANVRLGGTGYYMLRITSARDAKVNIRDLELEDERVLSLRPRTWFDRTETIDRLGNQALTASPEGPQANEQAALDAGLQRIPGLVAEEVEELGLEEFVIYEPDEDDHGKRVIESVAYDRIAVALIKPLRRNRERVKALEQENKELHNKVDDLEARLARLEAKLSD